MMNEIAIYWDKQSEIWSEEKKEAWLQPVTNYWQQYFKSILPGLTGNKVLEVGTASGYFANILASVGYEVTAIDISPNMIEEAQQVSEDLQLPVTYQVMDAQELSFADHSFDLVFTRLMTWTTPDIEKFYGACYRVLQPGGRFLNFDGDFGKCLFSQDGHERYPADIMEQANAIKSQLDISQYKRPERDLEILEKLGFVNVTADLAAEAKILQQAEGASGLFKVEGIKPL